MTVPAGRRARGKRVWSWPQWGGSVVAVAASLAALSLPGGPARAATTAQAAATPTPSPSSTYDQMTGSGPTASEIQVPWTKGILDDSNNEITSADANRTSGTGPLSFMYNDFKNLVVTVSQTKDIEHQGITVSWTGGVPSIVGGTVQANFLQMMECWGDASTGPNPEQCEFGAPGLQPSGSSGIGQRGGKLCTAGAAPSVTSPPSSLDGSGPSAGCDTEEPADSTHTAPCPGPNCNADDFYVPFEPVSPVDPTKPYDYNDQDTTNYNQFNSDEVEAAVTGANGDGQQQFQTLTGNESPALGCGEPESDNTPRGCWLVIVPRGQYEPNGYQVAANGQLTALTTSPLAASNWAQRIQIHLDFAPVGSFCPIGTLERQTFGTQLIARAMQSWELSLNQSASCSRIYGYSSVFETQSTNNLQDGGDAGLAFTTIPIGSEAARDNLPPPTNLPPIVYAPVAIAALDFGFNINYGFTGYVSTPVKLTPLLVAKALTQSYLEDLPDYYPYGPDDPGPKWAQANPYNISIDPSFQTLNGGNVPADPTGPIAPLLTEDHSALNQQIWQWVQASSAATTWLGGTPDANDANMTIDPDYKALNLGQGAAIDSFPRAYTGNFSACLPVFTPPSTSSPSASPSPTPTTSPTCPAGEQTETKTSIDLLPYTNNYDSAAAAILAGNNAFTTEWNYQLQAPGGSTGWWSTNPPEQIGDRFVWAADDTTDLAAYGLIPAQLCNDAGTSCVSPTTASVTAAVNSATADSAGLLEVNPASPGTGGYPLTQVIYAAVPTNQSPAALNDYAALISYAAGTGQTTGAAPGDLPPGYLPLTPTLQAQAQAVVTELQADATASPSASASSSSSSPASSSSSSSQGESPATTGSSTTASTGSSSSTPAGKGGTTVTPHPSPAPASVPHTTTNPGVASSTGTISSISGAHLPTCLPSSSASASHSPSPTASASHSPLASASHSPSASASPSPSVSHSPSCSPSPGATNSAGGPVISLPPAQAASGTTPNQQVGAVRWLLIGLAVTGGGFAGGGALLRSGRLEIPLWRRRWLE